MENNLLNLDNLVEEIKEKQEEKARLEELYKAKLEQLEANYNMQIEKIDNAINYFKEQIRVQFETQPYKETKSQRKLKVLSGDIVIKKPGKKLEADKNALLEWGKNNASEYIEQKVIETFKWAEFKENLEITEDGQIVNTETGELVTEGVTVIDVPEEVIIK